MLSTLIACVLAAETPPASLPAPIAEPTPSPLTVTGSIEAYYQWNLARPGNGLTAFRGFDNRHNSLTLSNVFVDARYDDQHLVAALALQVGATPATYYAAEPALAGGAGVNATGAELWQFVQQANLGHRLPIAAGLLVQGGLFLSPIGPEGIAVKDNWNWSRSNLFFGLPFYHAGARATLTLDDRWAVTGAVYNGWNAIVDNNAAKSVSGQVTWTSPDVASASLLYFGGIERADGAAEGAAWRHLLDAHVTWTPTSWLALQAHGDVGAEPNAFGTSGWAAGAIAVRVQPLSYLYVAARADVFAEFVADNDDGTASAIFWPAPWVASPTLTVDLRPHQQLSLRAEYRHDEAGAPMFFDERPAIDRAGAAVLEATSQDTVTIGAVAWF